MKECKYNIYIKGDEPEKLEPADIVIGTRRELEILRLCLGDKAHLVIGNPKKNTTFRISAEADLKALDWDYRNPEEAYNVIERIKMPDVIEQRLSERTETMKKEYVHKVHQGNVLISDAERMENMVYFRGFNYIDELHSDHSADHLDKEGLPLVAMHWEHRFNHMVKRYNDIYRVQMPNITPHVCRHTYCSNMAKSGMNPKTLQYLMGHSDIGVTLNTYTHLGLEDAVDELKRVEELENARKEMEKINGEGTVSQKMFRAI